MFPRPPPVPHSHQLGAPLNSLFTITITVDRVPRLSSRGARAVTLVRDLVITATRTPQKQKGLRLSNATP